jgi:hypothetical protein
MLYCRFNGTPSVRGRVLILVCGYRGAPPFSVSARVPALGIGGRLANYALLLPLRQFVARNRDFFANPRDLKYQAGLARDLVALGQPQEVACIIDDALAVSKNDVREFEALGRTECRPAASMAAGAENFDTVALIFPDALGLGWRPVEKSLQGARNLIFVNGRRRALTLDNAARRALAWRRVLAKTRLPELAFAAVVLPVAAALAVADAMQGRS